MEAPKTTGLVNHLNTEKSNPQADVFWAGEFSQMILLKNQSAMAHYSSPPPARIFPPIIIMPMVTGQESTAGAGSS
ncbi:MAG: hypothetical protein WCF90_04040 [Methanomicrobiales archaeon]